MGINSLLKSLFTPFKSGLTLEDIGAEVKERQKYFNEELSQKPQKPIKQEYKEGIFDVVKSEDSSDTIITKTTEGIVEQIEDNDYFTGGGGANWLSPDINPEKKHKGINLRIKRGDLSDKVLFPQDFDPATRADFLGQKVSYSDKFSSFYESAGLGYLDGNDYELVILSGKQSGKKFSGMTIN